MYNEAVINKSEEIIQPKEIIQPEFHPELIKGYEALLPVTDEEKPIYSTTETKLESIVELPIDDDTDITEIWRQEQNEAPQTLLDLAASTSSDTIDINEKLGGIENTKSIHDEIAELLKQSADIHSKWKFDDATPINNAVAEHTSSEGDINSRFSALANNTMSYNQLQTEKESPKVDLKEVDNQQKNDIISDEFKNRNNNQVQAIESTSTVNDKIPSKQGEGKIEMSHLLENSPIKDLKKAISINDRYLFINELFKGDETLYERSIKHIQHFSILPEATYWINKELKIKLRWNDNSEVVQLFSQLVNRRFM